jgi:hypothetical protein
MSEQFLAMEAFCCLHAAALFPALFFNEMNALIATSLARSFAKLFHYTFPLDAAPLLYIHNFSEFPFPHSSSEEQQTLKKVYYCCLLWSGRIRALDIVVVVCCKKMDKKIFNATFYSFPNRAGASSPSLLSFDL